MPILCYQPYPDGPIYRIIYVESGDTTWLEEFFAEIRKIKKEREDDSES